MKFHEMKLTIKGSDF